MVLPVWLTAENALIVCGILLAISEGLDAIPQIHASSVWRLFYDGLKWLKGLLQGPKSGTEPTK